MTFPCQSKAKTNVKDLSYINLKTAVEEGGRSLYVILSSENVY